MRGAEKLTSRNVYARWEEVEIKGMIKTVIKQGPGEDIVALWIRDTRKVLKEDKGAEGNMIKGLEIEEKTMERKDRT